MLQQIKWKEKILFLRTTTHTHTHTHTHTFTFIQKNSLKDITNTCHSFLITCTLHTFTQQTNKAEQRTRVALLLSYNNSQEINKNLEIMNKKRAKINYYNYSITLFPTHKHTHIHNIEISNKA